MVTLHYWLYWVMVKAECETVEEALSEAFEMLYSLCEYGVPVAIMGEDGDTLYDKEAIEKAYEVEDAAHQAASSTLLLS
jgi:hypothetical protein